MYAQTIPALQKNLAALTKFLKKAEAHIDAQKLDKSVVLGLRIYPDMFPLLRQILLVTDFSKASLDAKSFEGAETREITMKVAGQDTTFSGQIYFSNMALPNIYFHMATAYNLLRGIGVPLGKSDFMGR
jgi:uncharacterized protein